MRPAQPRPDYEKLVDRILAGELTRQQAADLSYQITGLKPQTFLSWLRTSGKLEKLKDTRRNAGANSQFAHTDPAIVDAYRKALELALTGKVSVRSAALKYNVSYQYLLRKVQSEKSRAQGGLRAEQELAIADSMEKMGKDHVTHLASGTGKSGHALEFFKQVLKKRDGRPVMVVTKDGATDTELQRAIETWKEAKEQAQKALVVFASAEAALAAQEALAELREVEAQGPGHDPDVVG